MPLLEVDLGFAISVTDSGAEQTYENMKNVMKHIMETYGLVSIRYGVIMFGNSASTYIPFSQTFPDKIALTTLLDSFPPLRGGPDLRKALEEAKTLFDQATARPNAKKVLAVIIDNKSINNRNEIEEPAKVLEDDDVQVVPVGVGPNVDEEELETMTSNKQNIIKTEKNGDPSGVGEDIIQKIREGEIFVSTYSSNNWYLNLSTGLCTWYVSQGHHHYLVVVVVIVIVVVVVLLLACFYYFPGKLSVYLKTVIPAFRHPRDRPEL